MHLRVPVAYLSPVFRRSCGRCHTTEEKLLREIPETTLIVAMTGVGRTGIECATAVVRKSLIAERQ
jgi:hypothetical protein